MTTHVNCRHCRFEAVTGDRFADDTVATHEAETGHDVDSERVDGQTRLLTDGGWGEPQKRDRLLEQLRTEAEPSGLLRCKANRIAGNTDFSAQTVGKYLLRLAQEEPTRGVDVSVFHDAGNATVYEIELVGDQEQLVADGRGGDADTACRECGVTNWGVASVSGKLRCLNCGSKPDYVRRSEINLADLSDAEFRLIDETEYESGGEGR